MPRYITRPLEVDAVQWFQSGDHPAVKRPENVGALYRPYIETADSKTYITPGDYIIAGVDGEIYVCPKAVFESSYDPAPIDQPVPATPTEG